MRWRIKSCFPMFLFIIYIYQIFFEELIFNKFLIFFKISDFKEKLNNEWGPFAVSPKAE